MHTDKWSTQFILVILCSTRGTETARVEGLWLVSRPECSVSEDPDDSPEVLVCSPFIVSSQSSMRDACDVMIVCFDLPAGKPLCMCTRSTTIRLHICRHPHQNPKLLQMHPNLFMFSLTQILCLWHSPPNILVHPCTGVLIYLHTVNKTGRYNKQTRMMDATYWLRYVKIKFGE